MFLSSVFCLLTSIFVFQLLSSVFYLLFLIRLTAQLCQRWSWQMSNVWRKSFSIQSLKLTSVCLLRYLYTWFFFTTFAKQKHFNEADFLHPKGSVKRKGRRKGKRKKSNIGLKQTTTNKTCQSLSVLEETCRKLSVYQKHTHTYPHKSTHTNTQAHRHTHVRFDIH